MAGVLPAWLQLQRQRAGKRAKKQGSGVPASPEAAPVQALDSESPNTDLEVQAAVLSTSCAVSGRHSPGRAHQEPPQSGQCLSSRPCEVSDKTLPLALSLLGTHPSPRCLMANLHTQAGSKTWTAN